ncbi:hypothetical protein OIU13_09415 [Brevundimonas sp. BT-123]|uniref:hypothetical protein n=1 Tax=Brevundimonas sp. BT-123 TaxID=2986928 RepID=UPI0022355419|nr:hypothetical protein [Brevundimonas sp. BT-123]MCW0046748.1 hypothetical protein [Brevundimonas sp. BT-123]
MVNAPETMISPSGEPAALKSQICRLSSDGGIDQTASAISRIAIQFFDILTRQLADHLPCHPVPDLVNEAIVTHGLDGQSKAAGVVVVVFGEGWN